MNIDYLAKNVFKLATFFGKDLMVNVGDLSLNIQFVNLLGVYYRSNKYVDISSKKMSFRGAGKAFSKIGNFFKDLFQLIKNLNINSDFSLYFSEILDINYSPW